MRTKQIIVTKELTHNQFIQIDRLWNNEYPLKLNNRFSILLDGVENYNHYIILNEYQNVIAWAVDFEKDNELRFSIIVDSKYKDKGLGKLLINKLKEKNTEFYGWVIDHNNGLKQNGETYISPMPFYLKQDFKVLSGQRIETEIISAVKIMWKKYN